MTEFALIETRTINNASVDGYYNNENAWFSREQIGLALGYSQPRTAIAKIHNKHPERLNPLSVVTKLVSTDGKMYDTYLYSFRGVLEICRWSKQAKANDVMDALYDMAESVRKKGYYSCMSDNDLLCLLVDKCLDNPAIEERIKSKHLIPDMKKMRLRDERENMYVIKRDYERRCKELIRFYSKHPSEENFKADTERCTKEAVAALEDQCPHLKEMGMRKMGIPVDAKES